MKKSKPFQVASRDVLKKYAPGRARSLLCWSGDNCEVSTPDPIPNSAVNRLRANGTASIVAGE